MSRPDRDEPTRHVETGARIIGAVTLAICRFVNSFAMPAQQHVLTTSKCTIGGVCHVGDDTVAGDVTDSDDRRVERVATSARKARRVISRLQGVVSPGARRTYEASSRMHRPFQSIPT
jgi:hypothetical protein